MPGKPPNDRSQPVRGQADRGPAIFWTAGVKRSCCMTATNTSAPHQQRQADPHQMQRLHSREPSQPLPHIAGQQEASRSKTNADPEGALPMFALPACKISRCPAPRWACSPRCCWPGRPGPRKQAPGAAGACLGQRQCDKNGLSHAPPLVSMPIPASRTRPRRQTS